MSTAAANLETEVKFLAPDLAAWRAKLLAAGATLASPRVFERNVRYDNAWDGLQRKGQLLRLRQDARTRLTFKGIPLHSATSEAKVREELEVTLSDFDTMALLLNRLGFEPKQVYEKYRETFTLDGVEVVLDELPFGEFLELEGEERAIRAVAAWLGLDWQQRILDNYLMIMGRVKAAYVLAFDDLTFDNFRDLQVDMATLFARDG